MCRLLSSLSSTYIFQRFDEALLVADLQLVVIRVILPSFNIVEERSEPGLRVERINVGRVLQSAQQVLHVSLYLGFTVVQRAADHNLSKVTELPTGPAEVANHY